MKTQTRIGLIGKASILLLLAVGGLVLALSRPSVTAQGGPRTAVISTILAPELSIRAAEGGPRVWLEAPATAVVGERITVRLLAENVANLGGYEVKVKQDQGRLALLTAETRSGLARNSREQFIMDYVQQADGALLAAASCPVADCTSTAYQEATQSDVGASGSLELAAFMYEVRGNGELTLDLAEILLVDTAGRSLLASSHYEAESKSSLEPSLAALDLSGNLVVNKADAYMVVSAWRELQRNGRCLHENITFYDINGSGCLTVADVQTILAAWGQTLTPTPLSSNTHHSSQTIVVNSAQNDSDTAPGDGQCLTAAGTCTLRAAIEEANVLPGADTIHFDIRNSNGSCPSLVTILAADPLIIDAIDNASLTIDGYTQCGASPNTNWITGNAVIKIEIKGNNDWFEFGLNILSPDNIIKGLAIYNWHRQIQLLGSSSHDNTIVGNFLGTDAANIFTHGVPGFEGEGIRIELGASYNQVGSAAPAARNIISGNDQDGVNLQGLGADFNTIMNNYIGLRQTGDARLRNTADGVDIAEGVANNQIGGLGPGERNIISGSNRDGVELSHNINTQNNHVVGNFIGLSPSGSQTLYNGGRGVTFEDNVTANPVYRNVIVGNAGDGVRFYTVFDNHVYDNFIGVAPTGIGPLDVVPVPGTESGLTALPNGTLPQNGQGLSGVFMTGGSQGNRVSNSIIAYHPEYGIYINSDKGYLSYGTCEAYYNSFSQNSIYDNVSQGIRLKSGLCDDGLEYFPNQGIAPPQLVAATTNQVTGVTCAGCLVELFIADKTVVDNPGGDNWGEGKIYLAQGTANSSGNFVIAITGVNLGTILTAHTTDNNGNSSEFARNVAAVAPPVATATATGTPTPSNTPTLIPTSTHTPSPIPTNTFTPTPTYTNTPTNPVPTNTPTKTSTPMPTNMPTGIPSNTPMVTPTHTPVGTQPPPATATPTGSLTATPGSPSPLHYIFMPMISNP